MNGLRAGLLAAALVPVAALAAPYDGTYRQAANADCGLIGVDGGAVRIADGLFYGVGMECRMTQPVNVIDMNATLFTLQCSGQDSQWSERVMVMDAADSTDIIMVWNGYVFRYELCPAP